MAPGQLRGLLPMQCSAAAAAAYLSLCVLTPRLVFWSKLQWRPITNDDLAYPMEDEVPQPKPVVDSINKNHPLLSLPPELLEMIILNLSARDAISFSISSRLLFHGVSNADNSNLWFRVGRFRKRVSSIYAAIAAGKRLAGLSPGATDAENMVAYHDTKHNKFKKSPALFRPLDRDELEHRLDNFAFEDEDPPHYTPPNYKYSCNLGQFECTVEYPMNSNFRKILVDTMLGVTATGCQWCLCSPCAEAPQFVESLNMRVCSECFTSNVLPLQAIKCLSKINIGDSAIPPITCYQGCPIMVSADSILVDRRLIEYEHAYEKTPVVWRPHVQRLVWKKYGMDVDLDSLLELRFRKESYQMDLKTVFTAFEQMAFLLEESESLKRSESTEKRSRGINLEQLYSISAREYLTQIEVGVQMQTA